MEILVKAIAGSKLFGTYTEKSDTDYKGIYIPGRISVKQVSEIIDSLLNDISLEMKSSKLPEIVNKDMLDKLLINTHECILGLRSNNEIFCF